MGSYLDAVRERVVIFDGATGTNLQLRHLGADDFGGPAWRAATRSWSTPGPTSSPTCTGRSSTSAATWSRPTASGRLPWVLAEYGIGRPDPRAGPQGGPHRPGGRRPTATPARWVAGSLGPGTKIASLGQITFADQRDGYQEAAAGLLDGGRRPFHHRDRPGPAAGQGGHHRLPAGHGRRRPGRAVQVQVTIERPAAC